MKLRGGGPPSEPGFSGFWDPPPSRGVFWDFPEGRSKIARTHIALASQFHFRFSFTFSKKNINYHRSSAAWANDPHLMMRHPAHASMMLKPMYALTNTLAAAESLHSQCDYSPAPASAGSMPRCPEQLNTLYRLNRPSPLSMACPTVAITIVGSQSG